MPDSFNCTFMELKYGSDIKLICEDDRFNCTFMELKWGTFTTVKPMKAGFNCTFMELKYIYLRLPKSRCQALIVPLWN